MTDISDLGMLQMRNTNEETTKDDVPDPDLSGLEIGGDWILVRPVSVHTEKVGSVLLPEDFQDDVKFLHNVGKVLKIGPLAYKKLSTGESVNWFPEGLKEGDFVQYGKFAGEKFRYQGVNLALLKDQALRMKVANPKDMDAFVNVEN